MARLTDRTALTTAVDADVLHIVDVSDASDNASGTSKKITIANLTDVFVTSTSVEAADAVMDSDFSTNGLMKRTGAGTYAIVTDNSASWDTAYGWGYHGAAGYISDVTGANLSDLNNVTITSNSSGEILKWSGSAWINNTLAEAGIAAASHTHTVSEITDYTAPSNSVVTKTAGSVILTTSDLSTPTAGKFIVVDTTTTDQTITLPTTIGDYNEQWFNIFNKGDESMTITTSNTTVARSLVLSSKAGCTAMITATGEYSIIGTDPESATSTLYSLLFDGTNDQASIADAADLDGMAAGTIEFYFRTDYSAGFQKIFKKGSEIDIGINTSGELFAEINGVANVGTFSTDISDNTWRHVAISWDGTNIRAFVNGVQGATAAQAGTQGANANAIYVGHNGGSEYFNGEISKIRFSDTARYTAGFTAPTTDFTVDGNTVALYALSAGSGNPADTSGNSHTMTLDGTNPPAWSATTPY